MNTLTGAGQETREDQGTMSATVMEPGSAAATSAYVHDPQGCEPIRAELFGAERLEAHARALAADAKSARVQAGPPLLAQFAENRQRLVRAHALLSEATRKGEKFGSDADWLL